MAETLAIYNNGSDYVIAESPEDCFAVLAETGLTFKPVELGKAAAKLGRQYNRALIGVERNNHGTACILGLENYGKIFRDRDHKAGWLNVTMPVWAPAFDSVIALLTRAC